MKEELCQAFCNELTVRDVPFGLAVSTAFSFPDGDRIGFYVKTHPDGRFEIQDSGTVYPGLEASGLDLKNKSRLEAFHSLMGEYGIVLDDDDRDFRLSGEAGDLPSAALRFVSFLLRVGDLLLLAEDRVASTFRHDVERILRERIGEGALIRDRQPISGNLSDFPPDYLIQAEGKDPVALFLGTSDARVLEALFVQSMKSMCRYVSWHFWNTANRCLLPFASRLAIALMASCSSEAMKLQQSLELQRKRALAKPSTDETYSEAETEARREAALKRMLATPHKPHKPTGLTPSKEKKPRLKPE